MTGKVSATVLLLSNFTKDGPWGGGGEGEGT